jgi:hypothetical protein
MIMIIIVLIKTITTTKKVKQMTVKNVDRPEVTGSTTTSFGLTGAETLNLQSASFWLFSGSRSCNKANESKHSSDDMVTQLDSELEGEDT